MSDLPLSKRPDSIRWVLFGVALSISLVMVARSQTSGDQLHMLARGWLFAEQGEWVHYGMPTSAGGRSPGSLTSLLMGLPLLVWLDHRAATLTVLLGHVIAYLLLDRTVRDVLGRRERLLLAVIYWLNPWRVHFSGFVWNANYMVLFGAIHLWTIQRQRHRASLLLSFVHVFAVGAAAQLHSSAGLFVIASLLLAIRGYFKPSWTGGALGALAVLATLAPWMATVAAEPGLLPDGGGGFPGRGLLLVFPLGKGLLYLLRYHSLSFSNTNTTDMISFDFTATLPASADATLTAGLWVLTRIIAPLTVLVPLLAFCWLLRRGFGHWRSTAAANAPPRIWLRGALVWYLAAAAIGFGLSPTTAMPWQGFGVLPMTSLIVVLWLEGLLRTRIGRWVRWWIAVHAVFSVGLSLAMAFGAPQYRPFGDHPLIIAMPADHRMIHDLGIAGMGSVVIEPGASFWPDVLPRPDHGTANDRPSIRDSRDEPGASIPGSTANGASGGR